MKGKGYSRRKRLRLWNENRCCHWCGGETILPEDVNRVYQEMRARMATIDHLRARHHPERQEPPKNGERRLVLACWTCNNGRDKDEMTSHWTLEQLWERSGSYPRDHPMAIQNRQQPVPTAEHEHRCDLYAEHIGLCRCDCGAVEISYQNGRPHWHMPSRRGCSEREAPTIVSNGRTPLAIQRSPMEEG